MPGDGQPEELAQFQSGLVQRKPANCHPKIQRISLGAAGKAPIDLASTMEGEDPRGLRAAGGNRARTAKLRSVPPSRLKADELEHVIHHDLLPKLTIVDAWHDGLMTDQGVGS